jgi:hypothetical protein
MTGALVAAEGSSEPQFASNTRAGAAAADGAELGREIAAIERRMREDPRGYVHDEPLQARYRDLLDARLGTAPGPVPLAPSGRRLVELQSLMRDHRSVYWRGPESEALQSEYRALVTPEPAGLPATWRTSSESARQSLPLELLAEWDATGFEAMLARAQDGAAAIIGGIGDSSAVSDFAAAFGRLPERVRMALYRELVAGPPQAAAPAGKSELDALAATDFGAALIGGWRRDASQRLGTLLARVERVERSLKASHLIEFKRWWGGQTTRVKIAVLWILGGMADG